MEKIFQQLQQVNSIAISVNVLIVEIHFLQLDNLPNLCWHDGTHGSHMLYGTVTNSVASKISSTKWKRMAFYYVNDSDLPQQLNLYQSVTNIHKSIEGSVCKISKANQMLNALSFGSDPFNICE